MTIEIQAIFILFFINYMARGLSPKGNPNKDKTFITSDTKYDDIDVDAVGKTKLFFNQSIDYYD